MKNLTIPDNERLTELLNEVQIFADLELCRVICEYYSKYESPVFEGHPERSIMTALSNQGCKVYCRESLDWELYVPYKIIADFSWHLNFEVLVFAASWEGFSTVAKRIENLGAKCTVKVFAVKSRDEGWDKEIILQLIDWIENDTVPAEWKEDVKYKTIPR